MRLALTFPGQGSQSSGMGAAWRSTPQWALVEEASAATGRDVATLLLSADDDELRRTDNAQLATFVLSQVVHAAWRESLPAAPVAYAGHSLGEYSALAASGALTLAGGTQLVAARGDAMRMAADKEPGTMAAVLGLHGDAVATAVEPVEGCWVANLNGDGNVIITGTVDGVADGGQACTLAGARRVMAISVGGAFHSPLMEPAAIELGTALDSAAWSTPDAPVVANVDASTHTDDWAALLRAQLTSAVRWTECALQLQALGAEAVLELGPGKVLTGIATRLLDIPAYSVSTPEELQSVLQEVR